MIFPSFGIKFQQWFLATLKSWFFEWLFVTIGFGVVIRPNLSHKIIWFHWNTSLGNSKLWLCILVGLFAIVWPYEWWLICTLFLVENCTPWLVKVFGIFKVIHEKGTTNDEGGHSFKEQLQHFLTEKLALFQTKVHRLDNHSFNE